MLRILKGLPIAESELYKRRQTLLKGCKNARRASTLSNYNRKRNVDVNQSSVDYNERFGSSNTPVFTKYLSTSTVSHQATRRRVLPFYKSEVAQENTCTELLQ